MRASLRILEFLKMRRGGWLRACGPGVRRGGARGARDPRSGAPETAEAAPAGHGRVAAGVGEVGLEAAALGANAADRAGAEIDHQVEPGAAVGGSRSDNGAVIGIAGHRLEAFVMTEEREA